MSQVTNSSSAAVPLFHPCEFRPVDCINKVEIFGKEDVQHLPSSILNDLVNVKPHSSSEMNDYSCKDYARTKHSRNKRDSSRHNVKEQRGKNCQRRDKWLRDVVQQEKDRKKIVPHAMDGARDSLSAFVNSFTTFIENSPAAQSDAAQAIFHVENLAVLMYYLTQARTFDNYVVAIIGYMKCYVKTSLAVLVSEVHRLVMEKPHPIHSAEQCEDELKPVHRQIVKDVYKFDSGIYNDRIADAYVNTVFREVEQERKDAEKQRKATNTHHFNVVLAQLTDYFADRKKDIKEFVDREQMERMYEDFDKQVVHLYKDDSSVDTQGAPIQEVIVNQEECVPESTFLQNVKDAWDMLKTNPIFEKISFLITAAMASSICSFKEIGFEIAGIKLIHLEALKRQVDTIDIIDALISTFSWVVDTGSACLAEKSLAPILFADQRLKQYSRDSAETIALAGSAIAGNVPDLQLYERKVDELLEETRRIIDVTKAVAIKEMLSRKYIQLRSIKVDLINKHKNTQYRFAPIGFSLFGESSIGKSDVAEMTMKTALEAMGEDSSKKGIFTLNDADKYESQYTTDIKGVFIDDANNTASGFVEGAPTARFFRFFNNMSSTALKPDVDSKGNVFIEFKVGVLTTNTKTLGANIYSNYPISILRRFWHVSVEVQDKYKTPGGASLNVNHPDIVNCPVDTILDVWQFKIEEAIPDKTNMGHFKIAMYYDENGKKKACVRLNLQQYLQAVVYFSKQHKIRQDRQVARNAHLENFKCCKVCCMLPQYCKCPNGPQSLNEIYRTISGVIQPMIRKMLMDWVKSYFSGYVIDAAHLLSPSENDLASVLDEHTLPTTLGWMPDFVTQSEFFKKFIYNYHINRRNPNMTSIRKTAVKVTWILGFLTLLLVRVLPMWLLMVLLSLLLHLLFIIMVCDINLQNENAFLDKLFEEHSGKTLQKYGSQLRNHWATKYVLTAAGLSTIVWVLNVWNKQRREPHSLTDRHAIDLKPSWFGMTMNTKKAHCSSGIKGASAIQVASQLDMNLCWGRFTHPDGYVTKCCVFHPRKSIVLFPRHVFYRDANMRSQHADIVECQIFRNMAPGGSYKCLFRFDMVYHFPDKDMVAGYVPNCPDYRDKTKWLVDEQPEGHAVVRIATMEESGERFCITTSAVFGRVKHTYMSMMGASYKTDIAHSGSCMSVLVSETFSPAIVGFHIGGNTLSRTGISCTVTKKEYFESERWLEENDMYLSAHATDLPKTQYGKPLLVSEEVNPKCKGVIEQMNNPNAVFEPKGSTAVRSEMKSKVVPSILSKYIEKHMGIPNTFGPPKLKPNWKPFMRNLEVFSNPTEPFDPKLLKRAVVDYMKPLVEKMKEYAVDDIMRPLTMKETIMGIPGKRFIDALPMDTGVGFPLFGKKNKLGPDGHPLYFGEVWEGGVLIDRYPLPIILEEVDRILACYKRNERAYPVTVASLKDESTPEDKEKVRVFQAAAIALSILIRMYFLPIARFMCMFPLIAECAVGINAFSQDWQELMDHVLQFADDGKVLAWDFKEYDARMNSQLTRQAWSIFIQFAEFGGYDKASLDIMKAMIVDITHPLIDLNGTMIMATSMNTSGNNMTVMVNSVVNCLYLRMGFFTIHPEKEDFREFVKYTSYGDDGLGSNKRPETSKFNFATYQKFLADHGIKLTVPTKTDEVVDYLDLEKADFLKRVSKYIPEIDCTIGALDFMSIIKPLLSNLKSSSVTKVEQAASCIETALHELFAHGREEYERRRAQLKLVCEEANVPVPALDITFDERVAHWKEKYLITAEDTSGFSPVVQQEPILYLEESRVENTAQNQNPDITESHLIGRSIPSAHKREIGENDFNSPAGKKALLLKPQSDYEITAESLPMSTRLILFEKQHLLCAFEMELERGNFLHSPLIHRYADEFEEEPYCFWFRLNENERCKLRKHVLKYYKACGIYSSTHSLVQSGLLDDQIYPHSMPDNVEIYPQADTEPSTLVSGESADPYLLSENLGFEDAHPGFVDHRGQATDPLRQGSVTSDINLDTFFSRPIRIATLNWALNSNFVANFDPWDAFFANPRVINRISNYKQMKATLHVKFVINGNGFYYGRAMASYNPLTQYDNLTVTPFRELDMVLASQRPHIYINPTNSEGGTLVLPFFTPFNYLDIPTAQWRQMGSINVFGIVPLKLSTTGTTVNSNLEISVFAWAENVDLIGLTQQDPQTIVPQSASEYSGIVSKPASMVAKTASLFKSIPMISNFATATEMGARSIAAMAALFGYSKPSEVLAPGMRPIATPSMALCDGREAVAKLSVDSKQELTIDPKIAGLDMPDELTINSISNRESYFCRFNWQLGYPPESLIFNCVVDPCLLRQDIDDEFQAARYMPAVCFAAWPFTYWRGSLKYRFQIVCSQFHKGRLKFVYDPHSCPGTASEYNVAYTHIVDISECSDITITVGWGQTTPFRRHLPFSQDIDQYWRGADGVTLATPILYTATDTTYYGNGVLSVYVVNELTTNDYTIDNGISIMMSVSACDDFEVASPDSDNLFAIGYVPRNEPGSLLAPIDELESADEEIVPQAAQESTMEMDVPVEENETCRILGAPCSVDPIVNKIHFGETILSYRSLLKRFCLHEVLWPKARVTSTTNSQIRQYSWFRTMFPYYGGYQTTATPTITNAVIDSTFGDYAFANNTLLNYVTCAYGGWRGGIRYQIDTSAENSSLVSGERVNRTLHSSWSANRYSWMPSRKNRARLNDQTDFDEGSAPNFLWSISDFGTSAGNQMRVWANSLANSPPFLFGGNRWTSRLNPIHTFEVPYYSIFRFSPAKFTDMGQTTEFQDGVEIQTTTVVSQRPMLAYKYVAAAEDFTAFFYLGPPIFYRSFIPDKQVI